MNGICTTPHQILSPLSYERVYRFCLNVMLDIFIKWYNWGVGREMGARRCARAMVGELEKLIVNNRKDDLLQVKEMAESGWVDDLLQVKKMDESAWVDMLFGGACIKEYQLWFKDVFFDSTEQRHFLTLLAEYINVKILGKGIHNRKDGDDVNGYGGVFASVRGYFRVVDGFTRHHVMSGNIKAQLACHPTTHIWLEAELNSDESLVLDVFAYNPSYLKTTEMTRMLNTAMALQKEVFPNYIHQTMDILMKGCGEVSLNISIRGSSVPNLVPQTTYIPFHVHTPSRPSSSLSNWQCQQTECFSCRLIQKRGISRSLAGELETSNKDIVFSTLVQMYKNIHVGEFVWDILLYTLEPLYQLRDMFFFIDALDTGVHGDVFDCFNTEISTRLETYLVLLRKYTDTCITLARTFNFYGRHNHWRKSGCLPAKNETDMPPSPVPSFVDGAYEIISQYASSQPLFKSSHGMRKRINVSVYRRLWLLVHMITEQVLLAPLGKDARRKFRNSIGMCQTALCPGDNTPQLHWNIRVFEKAALAPANVKQTSYLAPCYRTSIVSRLFTTFFSEWLAGKPFGSMLASYLYQKHSLRIPENKNSTRMDLHLKLLQPFNSYLNHHGISSFFHKTFDGYVATIFKIFQYFSLLQRIYAWPVLRELYTSKKMSYQTFQRLFFQLHMIPVNEGGGESLTKAIFRNLSLTKIDDVLSEHEEDTRHHLKTAFTILSSHIPTTLDNKKTKDAIITKWKDLLKYPMLRFTISSSSSRLMNVGIDDKKVIALLKMSILVAKLGGGDGGGGDIEKKK